MVSDWLHSIFSRQVGGFSAMAINRVYNLVDDDSDAYRALFQDTDYQMIMRSLTRGRVVWKRHPSTYEVTTF